MDVPKRYKEIRQSLPGGISFGCGGISLSPLEGIEQEQVGYSVAADGTPLSSEQDGAWRPSWVVIGQETACGDPIFIDTASAAMPVFTAIHGEGAWHPNPVASSAEAFAKCVQEFSHISSGRSNPVEREANPLGVEERKRFLDRLAELNGTTSAPKFWDVLLES
jgi:hypothetical protein